MIELSDIVGPENAEDMTEFVFLSLLIRSYVLSFQDVNDIKSVLKDIIGNETVANDISTEILKSRGQVRLYVVFIDLIVERRE
jgi:hypothetical protein